MDRRERNFKWWKSFDERSMTCTIDNGGDFECKCPPGSNEDDCTCHENAVDRIPVKYEVCGTCDGKGKHVNPSIDSHGLTAEDFDEDPDFRENYFSGMYDVPCAECNGQRVAIVVDDERATQAQKDWVDEWFDDQAAYAAEVAAERRMGA